MKYFFTIIVLFYSVLFLSLSPVLAVEYTPGVLIGQYVKYGNFIGAGPGVEVFNDYDWLKLEIMDVSGKSVTLLSTSQYKNGSPIAGNGTVSVWNVETGEEDNVPSTQGPIIAANLNQGDPIPPPNTYIVNRTETRTYVGVSRMVNVLDVTLEAPTYSTTLTYVYDKASGMILESTTQTTTKEQQPVTTSISYSVTETNIFQSALPPVFTQFPILVIAIAIVVILLLIIAILVIVLLRKR